MYYYLTRGRGADCFYGFRLVPQCFVVACFLLFFLMPVNDKSLSVVHPFFFVKKEVFISVLWKIFDDQKLLDNRNWMTTDGPRQSYTAVDSFFN